jgi:hypothetical protein
VEGVLQRLDRLERPQQPGDHGCVKDVETL